jgi:hypothetical protein
VSAARLGGQARAVGDKYTLGGGGVGGLASLCEGAHGLDNGQGGYFT